ncbi:hypothetical protein V2J09_020894 [Rumex salicifolius]
MGRLCIRLGCARRLGEWARVEFRGRKKHIEWLEKELETVNQRRRRSRMCYSKCIRLSHRGMMGIVKGDIMGFIKDWGRTPHGLDGLNHKVVRLLPKVSSPRLISEFRPISLCSVLYKILSKVLANRLRTILGGLISDA